MSKSIPNNPFENQITFKEVMLFLSQSWKVLLLYGFSGVIISIFYLMSLPQKYQSTALIQIPYYAQGKLDNKDSSFQEQNLVISALKYPSFFTESNKSLCGYIDEFNSEYLNRILKISTIKNSPVVELKVTLNDKTSSTECIQSIVDRLKSYQNEVNEKYIQRSNDELVKFEKKLMDLEYLMRNQGKTDQSFSLMQYYLVRDEVKFLKDEISKIKDNLKILSGNKIELLVPLYSEQIDVRPGKISALVIGFFLGILMGFLIFILRKLFLVGE